MATRKVIEDLQGEFERATSRAKYRMVIARIDAHAKPLAIRKQHIETTLSDLQSLRIKAETGLRRAKA